MVIRAGVVVWFAGTVAVVGTAVAAAAAVAGACDKSLTFGGRGRGRGDQWASIEGVDGTTTVDCRVV